MPKNELTDAQLEQCDLINGIAYQAMCDLLGRELEWDMEWIGEVSDVLCRIAVDCFDKTEMEIYPYIDESEEDEDA